MRNCIFIFSLIFNVSALSAAQVIINLDNIPYKKNQLKNFRGTSIHWVEDGDGLHLSQTGKQFSFNDTLVESLHYNVLRIPGGYLTRWFDWETAVGSDYGMQRNYHGKLEKVKTGLREMKLFAWKQGMKVMYTLNINDSPEKITKLIKTWNSLPPNNGPTIDWFELGNENYDTNSTQGAAIQYVNTVLPIIRAIRSVSPKANIGALLANPVAPAWDTTIYSLLHEEIDFLVWHRYVPYTDYTLPNSYQTTIASFSTVENELKYIHRLMTKRKLPVYLTEYNLSYYTSEKVHQNIVLEPRYNFLLGNFLTLAFLNGIDGMVKHCLASSGYHIFADINFSRQVDGTLSISGKISKELNRWMGEQDSVAVLTFDSKYSPWEFSVLAGKNKNGVELVVQNHTMQSVGIVWNGNDKKLSATSVEYFQHKKTMWTDRKKTFLLKDQFLTRAYSLNFFRIYQ